MGQRNIMPMNIGSYTFDELAQRAKPAKGGSGVAEANIDVLFDTQTLLAAGLVKQSFFVNVNADETLSNITLAGQSEADSFFDVWRVFVDANRLPTAVSIAGVGAGPATTAVGAINDIATILHSARATLTFKMFSKPVGPIPLTFFGNSGSVEGNIALALSGAYAAATTQSVHQQVGRMPDNGGWPVNGTIRIPPLTKFGWTLDVATGVTMTTDTPLRLTMLGVKYRRNA